jgi:PAS domain S-box-containing protein
MSAVLWTVLILDLAALVAVGTMLVLTWTNRHPTGGRYLLPMLVGVEAWVLGDLVAQLPVGLGVLRAAVTLQLVASGGVVLCLLLFVLTYTGRDDVVDSRFSTLLLVEPVGFALLTLTNPVHRLVFREPLLPDSVVQSAGPALLGHVAYSYALVGVAVVLAVDLAYRSELVYRRQATALTLGVLAPFVGNVVYFFGPVSTDLTPLMFAVTGGLLTYAALRVELLDLSPVARSVVLETISNGVLVLDRNAAVLDSNPQARRLLGIGERVTIGRPVTGLLGERSEPIERLAEAVPPDSEHGFELEVDDRILEVRVTPLRNVRDRPVGAVLVLHDVTARERQRRTLRRQRERLERFADVVSHDLRNPLNVAMGGVAIAIEDGDTEPLDLVVDAHERMGSILEETLVLAREGEALGEPEPVRLDELCEHCWAMVGVGDDGSDGTLVTDSVAIYGDGNRLRHLFENLFRNAVEHGSTGSRTQSGDAIERGSTSTRSQAHVGGVEHSSANGRVQSGDGRVTVHVGPLDDGFYVEDDGPGIPAEARTEVFEPGHSLADGNTGLGLAIVEEIVDAHGWEIAITDADDGGARFEITGVELVDR